MIMSRIILVFFELFILKLFFIVTIIASTIDTAIKLKKYLYMHMDRVVLKSCYPNINKSLVEMLQVYLSNSELFP